MIQLRYLTLYSVCFAIVGVIFSIKFQGMAYLGQDGILTMPYYWLGVGCAYFCATVATILLVFRDKSIFRKAFEVPMHILAVLMIIWTFLVTTFIIIAWQSGF